MHETTLERTITLAIFVASYVGLGLGRLPGFRVDRTGVAIIGGTLMVLSGVLPWNDAVLAVDVATLTGNPQNMLIGSFSTLTYREFLVREGPIALLGLVCVFIVVWCVYRRELPEALTVSEVQERVSVHYPLMVKTVAAVGVMLIAFLAGVPIALVAIGGAA